MAWVSMRECSVAFTSPGIKSRSGDGPIGSETSERWVVERGGARCVFGMVDREWD